jgi:hypothetical protein
MGACLGGDPTEPGSGQPTALLVHANLSATTATTVVLVVTAPDITTPLLFNIPVASGVASGTIVLTSGSSRTIAAHAYDNSGIETHRGAVTVNILPGSNPRIALVMVALAGDEPIDVTLGSFVVTVAPVADTLPIGASSGLTATILDGIGQPVLQSVTWATLNSGIATVVRTGDRTARVTAVAPGSTTIIASFGGNAGTATILVSAAPTAQLVASGLTAPLYLTQPPGDTSRLFVVEQGGKIRLIKNGTLLATPFLDITSLVISGGERGLLSMAFHPNYANNGQFFVAYTEDAPDPAPDGDVKVVRYTVSANPDVANPASAQPIIAIAHATDYHNGGLVTFGPDGLLYIGVGDGGGATAAQDTTMQLGKLLRIDVNGTPPYVVPASNPFVGRLPASPEIWSYGLRNPWRFSFDRLTGQLYIGDVGEGTREEIDVQPATSTGGENYGWNILEGSGCFNGAPCSSTGTVLPVFEYPHSGGSITGCAITGGYVYRGARLPLLAGLYFYADYCSGWVRSLRYANGVVSEHHDYTPEFGLLGNITSFGQDSRGELYIVTQAGGIYRIAPAVP